MIDRDMAEQPPISRSQSARIATQIRLVVGNDACGEETSLAPLIDILIAEYLAQVVVPGDQVMFVKSCYGMYGKLADRLDVTTIREIQGHYFSSDHFDKEMANLSNVFPIGPRKNNLAIAPKEPEQEF